jgi:hypothetical protein
MTNNDHHLNPNWAVGISANGGHKNVGEELNEVKFNMMALQVFFNYYFFNFFFNRSVVFYQTKVRVLETENKQLVDEKKIQEDKCSKLEQV